MFSPSTSRQRKQNGGAECLYDSAHCEYDSECRWDPNANDGVGKCVSRQEGQTGQMGGRKKGKPAGKETDGTKKNHAERERSFAKRKHRMAPAPHYDTYIKKLLQSMQLESGITAKTMIVMNAFIKDMIDRIVTRAVQLCKRNQKVTLTVRDIESAVRLELPKHMAPYAESYATKAITTFFDKIKI